MASLAPTLAKEEFKNWVKGAIALLFTKNGLKDFVSTLVVRHHQRLLQLVPAANIHKTCTCTIKSLPECTKSNKHGHIVANPRQMCARGVCNILMDCICKDHRFRGPSWKNTDPQKWCTDAFEIAKCYMAREGYSQKSSLNEIDFNGILSVVINNLSVHVQDIKICTKARELGNAIRHSTHQLLSDSDLRDYIDNLINLLCAPVCLINDPSVSLVNDISAQEAVRNLRMLKINTLTIHDTDITAALTDDIRQICEERKKTQIGLWDKLTFKAFRLRSNIKEDLITYYRENESQIPAAPLVDEHKVALEDLYVIPPMWAYDNPYLFGPGNERHKGSKVG